MPEDMVMALAAIGWLLDAVLLVVIWRLVRARHWR